METYSSEHREGFVTKTVDGVFFCVWVHDLFGAPISLRRVEWDGLPARVGALFYAHARVGALCPQALESRGLAENHTDFGPKERKPKYGETPSFECPLDTIVL